MSYRMLKDYNICDGFYQNAIKKTETKYFSIGNLAWKCAYKVRAQK